MTFQGFAIPDDLRMLAEVIGAFVRREIGAVEQELAPDAREIPADRLFVLQEKARSLGFWCLEAPKEFGGCGLSAYEMAVVLEQAVKHKLSFPFPGAGAFGYNPPVVLYKGNGDQVERYVRPTIDQAWLSFTAISEPTGG